MARVFGAAATFVANAATASVVAFHSPYTLGDYTGPNPLSPTSVARMMIDRTGEAGGTRDFGVDPAFLAEAMGIVSQETRDVTNAKAAVANVNPGAVSGLAARRSVLPGQEARDLSQYDAGRIKAEIAELADRARNSGYDTEDKKQDSALPMQRIMDAQGRVLMQGRAESVEHLIVIKMAEAEKTNDPSKKVLNLSGAQLDEHTLGRPLQLKGFDFKNTALQGANLAGAQITDCGFKNCDMEGVNLKKATISLSSFENVNMNGFVGDSKTKFDNCAMNNVHMQDAVAPEVKFENIRADRLNIAGANFAGSSWTHVHVNNLWAERVNLNGAKMGDFHVRGHESSLEGAKMNGATVHNASFGTPQYGINMRGLEAQNSTWSDVQFNKSDLSKADFTKASFTRVDMRNVVTPKGPMEMREANLTGLTAGEEAKFTAYKATHSGITMFPNENFVFRGTAPIERAAQAALAVRSDHANIVSADGATQQELEARNALQMQQQMMQKKRMQMAMAPAPSMGKRKDQPWG